MSFFYAPPPPPLFATANGGVTASSQPQQGSYSDDDVNADVIGDTSSSSTTSVSSSIVVVIIIISSAIIVSASIYILLRFLSRRFRRTYAAAADDVVEVQNDFHVASNLNGRHVSSSSEDANPVFDSLPLFTFGSVTGNLTGGDCAVCLSKFEPHDQLRLLPLCCHAFHARCIDTWLSNNQTCPLCRSTVYPTDADVLNKILSISNTDDHRNVSESNSNGSSFRIEIGSISRRRGLPDAASSVGDGRRSYSIGSFDYIVDENYEVSVDSTHRRGLSECTSVDKESSVAEPPGESLAAEVAGGRSWLRDYVDRLSSRAVSFRSSGRFFSGSSRRSDVVVPVEDLEANRMGEEISELFRWLSGV